MGFKITNEELDLFFRHADDSVAMLFLLIALRCTERGGPGREMGIMDKRADTFEKQIRWARNTVLSKEKMYEKTSLVSARDLLTKLFTDEFVAYFSSKYAPIGVENDPANLNKNHLKNLRFFLNRCHVILSEV